MRYIPLKHVLPLLHTAFIHPFLGFFNINISDHTVFTFTSSSPQESGILYFSTQQKHEIMKAS